METIQTIDNVLENLMFFYLLLLADVRNKIIFYQMFYEYSITWDCLHFINREVKLYRIA